MAILGDRRSIVGLMELTERGERSIERREEFCKGEGEGEGDDAAADSDPTPLLLSLLTRGVAAAAFFGVSDAAFFGVSADKLDLFVSSLKNNNQMKFLQNAKDLNQNRNLYYTLYIADRIQKWIS